MALEYIVGPVLALLVGMKFTDFKYKELEKKVEAIPTQVDEKITEQNILISQQTLKIMTPVAKSVQAINQQLGL